MENLKTLLLTNEQIIEMTGLSRTTLYRLEQRGEFPARLHLSQRVIRWHRHEIENWLKTRPRGMLEVNQLNPNYKSSKERRRHNKGRKERKENGA